MAVKLLDLIFFGRPMLVVPVWTVYLHAVAVCGRTGYLRIYAPGDAPFHLAGLTLIFMGVYVFNQIFDVDTDRINDKLFFLPHGIISKTTAWGYYLILTPGGLLLMFSFAPEAVWPATAIVALGILYSIPKVRLKDNVLGGLLTNAAAFGWCLPWMAAGQSWDGSRLLLALPYVTAIAAGYILTTIPDRDGDAAAGKKTIAVVMGARGAIWSAMLFSLATVVMSLISTNYELMLVALVTMAGTLYLLIAFDETTARFTCKFPILLLTLAAGAHFPFYLLILLLTTILTRLYYRERFGMEYPRLS